MTADEMKLARDGWLSYGPKWGKRGSMLRAVFEYVERLPNGNVITTDGGRGEIEWASSSEKASVNNAGGAEGKQSQ